jgi:hypothetical protein
MYSNKLSTTDIKTKQHNYEPIIFITSCSCSPKIPGQLSPYTQGIKQSYLTCLVFACKTFSCDFYCINSPNCLSPSHGHVINMFMPRYAQWPFRPFGWNQLDSSKLRHKLELHISPSLENWNESTMYCPGAKPQHTSQQQS